MRKIYMVQLKSESGTWDKSHFNKRLQKATVIQSARSPSILVLSLYSVYSNCANNMLVFHFFFYSGSHQYRHSISATVHSNGRRRSENKKTESIFADIVVYFFLCLSICCVYVCVFWSHAKFKWSVKQKLNKWVREKWMGSKYGRGIEWEPQALGSWQYCMHVECIHVLRIEHEICLHPHSAHHPEELVGTQCIHITHHIGKWYRAKPYCAPIIIYGIYTEQKTEFLFNSSLMELACQIMHILLSFHFLVHPVCMYVSVMFSLLTPC